jgi:hypothetical protein
VSHASARAPRPPGAGRLALIATAICACEAAAPAALPAGAGGDSGALPAPPRPLSPISVSILTSRRPTFRWQLADGTEGARVEICGERACHRVLASFDAAGDEGTPSDDLPTGTLFWRLRGRAGDTVGSTPSATWELVVPPRSSPVSTAWGAALDANGDGFADVVVGDADEFLPTRRVFVFAGGRRGPPANPTTTLSTPNPIAGFASSIASAGDVDGDGFGDLLVGSPKADAASLYRGGPRGFEDTPATLSGPAGSAFGAAVSGAGDIDGDGYADVVIGLPSYRAGDGSPVQGAATVFFGGPDGLTETRSAALPPGAGADGQQYGRYVSSAGDMDGDGLADVAVWAGIGASDPQEITLYLGRDRPWATPSATLHYEGSVVSWLDDANLLACAGDVNGDGLSDLAVATPAQTGVSYVLDHVTLFLGRPGGPSEQPSFRIANPLAVGDHFGLSLAAGDLNGDGFGDLLIGVASAPASSPLASIVYDGDSRGMTFAQRIPTSDTIRFHGREVGLGDVDGDGFPDAVIAYPARETPVGDGGVLHGAVEIHRGGPGGVAAAADWTLLAPDTTAAAFGGSLVRP